jgi:ankyrin repeat protein
MNVVKSKKILNLINDKKWNEIYNLIKANKINMIEKITNGRIISHLAAANNNSKIIEYLCDKYPYTLSSADDDGNSPTHIMIFNGNYKLFKNTIKKMPELINLINNNNESVLHLINKNNNELFRWLIINISDVNLNIIDGKGETVLLHNIKKCSNFNKNFENIKLLVQYKADIEHPKINPPLCVAIINKAINVVKYLVKNGANINSHNNEYKSPLLLSIYNKTYEISKYLIEHGANVNYFGAEGDHNPLIIALLQGDIKIIEMLINNGFNLNNHNRFMDTTLHIAFSMNPKMYNITPSLISKLLFYGNINAQNIKGTTPLHIFIRNYNWESYNLILQEKQMNIFLEDEIKKTPIFYVKNDKLDKFMEMVTHSYSKHMKYNNNIYNDHKCTTYKMHCKNRIQNKECIDIIKTHILSTKRSCPENNDKKILQDKLNVVKGNNSRHGKFNSDTFHSVIYTVEILKKYKNLGIPSQYFIHDKNMTEKIRYENLDLMITPEQRVISDLFKIYIDFFYEIFPYLIVWRSSTENYINKNIDFYLQRVLWSNKIRFIFLKLTLITSESGTHANIIIFDKKKGILERFEPYGHIPYLENNLLDNFLLKKLGHIFKKYLGLKKFEYLRPKDYLVNVGFQTISNDNDATVRKLGDPIGYCLAWTMWYLEMRLTNSEVHPIKLIKNALKIIPNYSKKDNSGFINFIRNYSTKLDEEKNLFLTRAGINKKLQYNIIFREEDYNKLIKQLVNDFEVISKKW